MGREVRRVPVNWKHPKKASGSYIPLNAPGFEDDLERWEMEWKQWEQGFRRKGFCEPPEWEPHNEERTVESFSEWHGERPVKSEYMPSWPDEARTHYQMYQTVSEGTPISPVLPTPEALARWLVDNKANAGAGEQASYEAWLRVCNGGYASSMVVDRNPDGSVLIRNGVEGLTEKS